MFLFLTIFEGIRALLLESEEQECPNCHNKSVSPDTLIPNRFLRSAVTKFRSDTGYTKAAPPVPTPAAPSVLVAAPEAEETEEPNPYVTDEDDDDGEDDREEPELILEVRRPIGDEI